MIDNLVFCVVGFWTNNSREFFELLKKLLPFEQQIMEITYLMLFYRVSKRNKSSSIITFKIDKLKRNICIIVRADPEDWIEENNIQDWLRKKKHPFCFLY